MKRTASEVIRELEDRIAQLEKQSSATGFWHFQLLNDLSTKLEFNSPLDMLGKSLDRIYRKDFEDLLKRGANDELVKELMEYSNAVKSEQEKLKSKVLDIMISLKR